MNPKNPHYIDVHSHLNFDDYDTDRRDIIDKMNELGIWTITVGTDHKSSVRALEISEESGTLFASVGLHPKEDHEERFDKASYRTFLDSEKVVAIGECGLDFARLGGDEAYEKNKQKECFEAQIEFAAEADLPLMIHCREAYRDVIDILSTHKKTFGEKLRGNIHFYAGSIDEAKQFLELDFSLSFTGVITFTEDYNEVIKYAPIQAILSETDSPFVSPAPYRGKRNDPTRIREVVKKLAEIRNMDFEELRQALVLNAFRVFALEKHIW